MIASLAWGGCTTTMETPPLSEDVMVDLLVDLHLAHAQVQVQPPDSTQNVDSLLDVHGASRQAFEETIAYYARNPESYVALLDSVIDRLRVTRPSIDTDADNPMYARPYGSLFRDTLAELSE